MKSFLAWLVDHVPAPRHKNPIEEVRSGTYEGFLRRIEDFFADLPFGEGQKMYVLINLKEDGPNPKREGTITAKSLVSDINEAKDKEELSPWEALDLKFRVRDMVGQAWTYHQELKTRRDRSSRQLGLFEQLGRRG